MKRFAEYAPFVEHARPPKQRKSEMEWKAVLPSTAFQSLRQRVKEQPGTGAFSTSGESGVYKCAGCGNPLFSSTAKFVPPTGPSLASFYAPLPSALDIGEDGACVCVVCEGYIGSLHTNEGFATPTDERFAVLSDSVTFTPVGFAQDGTIDTRLIAPQFLVYRTVYVVYHVILLVTVAAVLALVAKPVLPPALRDALAWAL